MNKKILTFLTIIIGILIYASSVKAVIIDNTGDIEEKVTIWFIDYENHFNERPQEVKLHFIDRNNSTCDYTATLKISDCTLTLDTDGVTTICEGSVYLPSLNSKYQNAEWELGKIDWTNREKTYEERDMQGGIVSANYQMPIFAVYLKNLSEFFNVTVNWDDDSNRDDYRNSFWIEMEDNNQKTYEEKIGTSKNLNDNTWKMNTQLYLPTYLEDANQKPIWDTPISYAGKIKDGDTLNNYYKSNVETNGKNVIINLKHDPNKLSYNVPVKVTWKDVKDIPNKINIKAYCDDRTYQDAEITNDTNWEYTFSELLENGGYHQGKAVYKIQVEDIENYNFEVKGNQIDGFEIIATQDEEKTTDMPKKDDKEKEDTENKKPQEVNKDNKTANEAKKDTEKVDQNTEDTEKNDEEELEIKQEESNKEENSKETDNEPETGTNNYDILASILTFISLTGIIILRYNKK